MDGEFGFAAGKFIWKPFAYEIRQDVIAQIIVFGSAMADVYSVVNSARRNGVGR